MKIEDPLPKIITNPKYPPQKNMKMILHQCTKCTFWRISRVTPLQDFSPVFPTGLKVSHLLFVDQVQHLFAMFLSQFDDLGTLLSCELNHINLIELGKLYRIL
jgi:hypothetical protein